MSDLMTYLERLHANCCAVAENSAASAEARAQARDWRDLLIVALKLVPVVEDPETMLLHWDRLTTRWAGELKAGLHLGGGL